MLTAPGAPESQEVSGHSICLSFDGSVVSIGARGNDGNGSNSGHVRVYTTNSIGVFNINETNFVLYPNPTKGIINIKAKDRDIKKIIISDVTGKTIIEQTEIQQKETIDLSGFKSGIYIISIQTEKEIFTKKIIKR